MSARPKHIALISDQYALQGRFYEAAFGMRTAEDTRPERAVTVSDGYVGLNINPRKAGRPAGLDHFGLEVDEVEPVLARLRGKYPAGPGGKRPPAVGEAARRSRCSRAGARSTPQCRWSSVPPRGRLPASARTIRTATCSTC